MNFPASFKKDTPIQDDFSSLPIDSHRDALKRPSSIWLMSDGKAGDKKQIEAIAQALKHDATHIDHYIISLDKPWSWLAPYGKPPAFLDPHHVKSQFQQPFPDMVIGTGRRCVPILRRFKHYKGKRPFTIFLKNPRLHPEKVADFVWTPLHDQLKCKNVFSTLTGPTTLSEEDYECIKQEKPKWLENMPAPRLSVVLGGNAGKTRFSHDDGRKICLEVISQLTHFKSVLVTSSRRTPDFLIHSLIEALAHTKVPHRIYTGQGENPYPDMLGHSQKIIVTGDSHNMVSEVLASGRDVSIFKPSALQKKMRFFLHRLDYEKSHMRRKEGRYKKNKPFMLNATNEIAHQILERWHEWCHIEE